MNKKTFQKVLIACVGFLIFVTFMAVIFHHFADTKDEPVSAKPNKVVYLTFDDGPSKNTKAVLRILKHYDVELNGANVAVLGRSMVVGKPAAMLLLNENATVTICHSRTKNLEKVTSQADILVAAVGRAKMIKENSVKEGAVVIDVGINVDENGNLCGDVDTASVQDKVSMITPVPAGVGSVTTSILAKHVVKACKNQNNK